MLLWARLGKELGDYDTVWRAENLEDGKIMNKCHDYYFTNRLYATEVIVNVDALKIEHNVLGGILARVVPFDHR